MAKNEVAEVKEQSTDLSVPYDWGGDGPREGFEDVTLNDLSIPFLNILQPTSPELEEQTIPGCKAGDIVNSVTKEIMKQPIIVQPFYREHVWVNWRPRNQGGGVISRHEPSDDVVLAVLEKNGGSHIPPKGADGKRIPFKGPDGGEIVETFNFYCLLLEEDGETAAGYGVMSFTSTKVKVQKDWMSSMFMVKGQPPLHAFRAKVSTVREKRDSGTSYNFSIAPFKETWGISTVDPRTPVGRKMMDDAKSFRQMVESGFARADIAGAQNDDALEGAAAGNQSSGKNRTAADDDEIPF